MNAVDFFEEQEQQQKAIYEKLCADLMGHITDYAKEKGITPKELIDVIALGASYEFWGEGVSGDLYPLVNKVHINHFLSLFNYASENDSNCFIKLALRLHGFEFNEVCLITHKSQSHRDELFNKGVLHYSQDHKTIEKDKLALIMSAHIYFTSKSQSIFTSINDFTFFESEKSISACPNGNVVKSLVHGITYKLEA